MENIVFVSNNKTESDAAIRTINHTLISLFNGNMISIASNTIILNMDTNLLRRTREIHKMTYTNRDITNIEKQKKGVKLYKSHAHPTVLFTPTVLFS